MSVFSARQGISAQDTGSNPGEASRPSAPGSLTHRDVQALYERPPSFTPFLPWVEYLPDSQCFLLEDGVSVGALFDLTPVGTEARTGPFMVALRDAIQTALTRARKTLRNLDWFEVKEIRGSLRDGYFNTYQVVLEVGFRLDDED